MLIVEAVVFICSLESPQRNIIELSKKDAKNCVTKATMQKYFNFPTQGIINFIRVLEINELVYFAEFKSSRKISDGICVVTTLRPKPWGPQELPETGPNCLSFFYTKCCLKFKEAEKEYKKLEAEQKQNWR